MPRSQIARWEADTVEPGSPPRAVSFAPAVLISRWRSFPSSPTKSARSASPPSNASRPRSAFGRCWISWGRRGDDEDARDPPFDPTRSSTKARGTHGSGSFLWAGSRGCSRARTRVPWPGPHSLHATGEPRAPGRRAASARGDASERGAPFPLGSRARQGTVGRLRVSGGRDQVVTQPAGTRGYDDLRHKGRWLHIGDGLRPPCRLPGRPRADARGSRPAGQVRSLDAMRRVVEARPGARTGDVSRPAAVIQMCGPVLSRRPGPREHRRPPRLWPATGPSVQPHSSHGQHAGHGH